MTPGIRIFHILAAALQFKIGMDLWSLVDFSNLHGSMVSLLVASCGLFLACLASIFKAVED